MGLFSIFSKKNNEIKKEITEDKNVVLSNESVNEADNKADKENDNKSALENSVESEQKSDEVKVDISEDKNNSSEEKKKKNKISFFEKLRKTRENLSYGLSALVKGRKIDDDLYDDLETSLLTADLGVETTQKVIEKLKKESKLRELHDASALKENLKIILNEILRDCAEPLKIEKNTQMPYVILMVGVNGAGKTTTIGKLASKFKAQGLKVMLAAGDTFRAAAVEQLKSWGERCDIPVVSQPTGSDSASVIYDALSSAIAHKTDVLICDTAGRLQNKDNLMEELKKITRVMKKHSESVPNEVMLVLDSTTGQNAISQMKIFSQAVNVTGITLTKLDGTAKGGIIFALSDQFKVPVRYIGIGEKVEDLREFDSESFVDALVD
ncbi:MAG: signal recognition particle-docking protein FtsY [Succinivibrio sp.]|uniref:Signal recognition particle receptor FtsY n=1 Tax=Succinivibrio faecicola TaxID=2820300 RepID=A0ABS7DHW7_9GAMM|nr:signal recognition particle-docking protein FtsY [Succinivibrio faecicola]MBW7570894.1 signal recognition particle-docking protein FtsY [Succinivibrio faecicola]MCI6939541.1 signal recognition particle-docking protein FtsY [Succinatimonas hippei]